MHAQTDDTSNSEDEVRGQGKSAMPGRRDQSKTTTSRKGPKQDDASVEDDGPACQSCRKKKAKCSRRQPCSHCVKFSIDCVYDDRKVKPGMRMGAVENLNQRVVALENMFLGQGILWQQVWNCLTTIQGQSPTSSTGLSMGAPGDESLKDCTNQLKNTLSNLSNGQKDEQKLSSNANMPNLKRRRARSDVGENSSAARLPAFAITSDSDENGLPADDLVDDLVEIYFVCVHPWIPILHVRQFRERMAIPAQRRKLTTIFHAIVSLCVRFSNDPRLSDPNVKARYSSNSRQTVILQSMESFSVENLQALVICAFDTIGTGRGPSAWSIVGSMTRTVEQLQLSVEENTDPNESPSAEFLIQRMAFLRPCNSWLEREERRRIFWNVFLMDRFCSVATGWNVSLTSADVKRRLPCEGALWEDGVPLNTPTPYFGIADKGSAGSLGNSSSRPEIEDQTSLGGFAYCIEATESLSLVTMFFLQHAVNVSDLHDVQMWMKRFKELDLRLIQWKIYLPEKWREASVLNADGVLDPNLTLAHITHNTAVGLLHQGIAYPSEQWQSSPIRLPSTSSAETCMAAATEISIIAEKFLLGSKILTNPQFAFCLFISGRMLLAHSIYYKINLPLAFDSLTNSLLEISRRWNGYSNYQPGFQNEPQNLASKFASRLIQASAKGPGVLDIRKAAYSEEQIPGAVAGSPQKSRVDANPPVLGQTLNASLDEGQFEGLPTNQLPSSNLKMSAVTAESSHGNSYYFDTSMEQEDSPDSISLAFPPLPLAFQPNTASRMPSPVAGHGPLVGNSYPGHVEGYDQNFPSGPAETYGNPAMDYGVVQGFEDLHSYFEYSFLPTQRISTFSSVQDPEIIKQNKT